MSAIIGGGETPRGSAHRRGARPGFHPWRRAARHDHRRRSRHCRRLERRRGRAGRRGCAADDGRAGGATAIRSSPRHGARRIALGCRRALACARHGTPRTASGCGAPPPTTAPCAWPRPFARGATDERRHRHRSGPTRRGTRSAVARAYPRAAATATPSAWRRGSQARASRTRGWCASCAWCRRQSRSAGTARCAWSPEHLADPLRWRRPRRVFVNSMSDLFHGSRCLTPRSTACLR